MSLDIVVGLQYGDEGKGKIVNYLASNNNYDYCIRYNGGPNAGHTIYLSSKDNENAENNGFHIEKDLVKKNINGKYKFLIVTEDLARNNFKANYNIESNPDTRLLFNSGVVFHKPYFNLKLKSSEILLADILLKVNADLDSSIVELFI